MSETGDEWQLGCAMDESGDVIGEGVRWTTEKGDGGMSDLKAEVVGIDERRRRWMTVVGVDEGMSSGGGG
ncbi:hypothetical protein HanRHA438_Chr13g0607081 [Helianthus annuus]|nr:hypothetical protein HanRHA438_Chr13g0607081 [Helianthus annuus]